MKILASFPDLLTLWKRKMTANFQNAKSIIQRSLLALTSVNLDREIKELPDILWAGEFTELASRGAFGNGNQVGLLVATNKRVIYAKAGWFSSLTVEDYTYGEISSLTTKTGTIAGEMVMNVSDGRVRIHSIPNDELLQLADVVKTKLQMAHSNPGERYSIALESVADELKSSQSCARKVSFQMRSSTPKKPACCRANFYITVGAYNFSGV